MHWLKKPPQDKQLLGREGEQRALTYLLAAGLIHIDSNFRRPFGEIDLIMQDQATLVFVEVRSRKAGRFGGAAASITQAKKRRLVLAAKAYLQRFRTAPPCRFDVIAIDAGTIEWIKNVIEG